MIPTQQKRLQFTIDDNFLKHVIESQAGSIQKAMMEIVMNSIDAKAKTITITATNKMVTVVDDGEGFSSIDDIVRYFGRFGTPHQDGDATFGRFRMGRGQLFSYGRCSWRSSTFKMTVDVENDGFKEYTLEENLEEIKGCIVECIFYKEEKNIFGNVFNIEREVKYCEVDIFFNDKQIVSNESRNIAWTYEDEDFKFYESSKGSDAYSLRIYNQGIYVCEAHPQNNGASGIFVSKKPLEVNVARNEVMVNRCKIWEKFSNYIIEKSRKEYKAKTDKIRKKKNIPKNERQILVKAAVGGEIPLEEFYYYKIFEDFIGNIYSLHDIHKNNYRYITYEKSSHNKTYLDALNNLKSVLVLSEFTEAIFDGLFSSNVQFAVQDILYHFNRRLLQSTINRLGKTIKTSVVQEEKHRLRADKERLDDLETYINSVIFESEAKNLQDMAVVKVKLIEKNEYTIFEKIILGNLNRISGKFSLIVGSAISRLENHWETQYEWESIYEGYSQSTMKTRKVYLADTAGQYQAYTNGDDAIYVDRAFIEKATSSLFNFDNVYYVFLHEYCHVNDSYETNFHSKEFYELFHEALSVHTTQDGYEIESFSKILRNAREYFVGALAKKDIYLSTEFSKILNIPNKKIVRATLSNLSLFKVSTSQNDKVYDNYDTSYTMVTKNILNNNTRTYGYQVGIRVTINEAYEVKKVELSPLKIELDEKKYGNALKNKESFYHYYILLRQQLAYMGFDINEHSHRFSIYSKECYMDISKDHNSDKFIEKDYFTFYQLDYDDDIEMDRSRRSKKPSKKLQAIIDMHTKTLTRFLKASKELDIGDKNE